MENFLSLILAFVFLAPAAAGVTAEAPAPAQDAQALGEDPAPALAAERLVEFETMIRGFEERLADFSERLDAVEVELGQIYEDLERDRMVAASFEDETRQRLDVLARTIDELRSLEAPVPLEPPREKRYGAGEFETSDGESYAEAVGSPPPRR